MVTLIVLAIYTVLILLLVPLEKIGAWQLSVKKWYKKLLEKFNN